MECSLLEIQKLAWILERVIEKQQLKNPLDLQFSPENYGPYAKNPRCLSCDWTAGKSLFSAKFLIL